MGYDAKTKRAYTDLSNSYIAFEAMRLTESVEDLRKEGTLRSDLDWKAAIAFIQRVHNHPDFNDQPWVADDPDNKGGFAYHPAKHSGGDLYGHQSRSALSILRQHDLRGAVELYLRPRRP